MKNLRSLSSIGEAPDRVCNGHVVKTCSMSRNMVRANSTAALESAKKTVVIVFVLHGAESIDCAGCESEWSLIYNSEKQPRRSDNIAKRLHIFADVWSVPNITRDSCHSGSSWIKSELAAINILFSLLDLSLVFSPLLPCYVGTDRNTIGDDAQPLWLAKQLSPVLVSQTL